MKDLNRASTEPRPSPRDVVLAPSEEHRSRGSVMVAIAVALAAHAGIVVLALRSGPSLETWSARVALGVHSALREARPVDLEAPPPKPPTPPPAAAPEPPAAPKLARASAAKLARTADAKAPPAAPAPAVAVATGPVDLTASAIVTGSALVASGGFSTAAASGTGTGAARSGSAAPVTNGRAARGPKLSRGVALDPAEWRCAWPKEAIAREVFEQSVVLRVVVRPDGRAESAQLLAEPGFGLGQAALECVRSTRFRPALDAAGRPVRATSPPIRIRFTR